MAQRNSCGQVRQAGRQLARGPEIRPKHPAGNLPLGGTVDLKSHIIRPATLPGLDLLDQALTNREPFVRGQLAQACPVLAGEGGFQVHAPKVDTLSPFGKDHLPIHFVPPSQTEPMAEDVWSKRQLFRDWVTDLKTLKGWTNAEVAASMKISPLSLKKYLGRSGTHKAGDDALRLLGDQLGRDYRLLLEDPGMAPPGIDPGQWSGASERTRVLASAMFQDLLSLPEGEQQIYYELWKKGQEIGRQRLAAEAAEKGKRGAKK